MDGRNQTASPGPGGSNQSPSTYQVNVNRKKTRKWVEAKVQSYDGDDWGAPESEDEEDSPVSAPPPLPRPTGGARLPSESRFPGAGRPGHAAIPSTSTSGQASVPVPTAQPPVEESVPAVTGPSNLTGSAQATDNVVSPLSEEGQAEPVLLPASTYGQQPKQDSLQSPQIAEPNSELESDEKRVSVSPQLPNVARMSGFGVDFFSAGGDAASNREPTVQEEREPSPQPVVEKPFSAPATKDTEVANEPAPPSAQPQVVEPEKTEAQEASQPSQPVPQRPSLPGQYVTEDPTHEIPPTPISPPAQVNDPEVSPVSEHAPRDLAVSSAGASDADSQKLQAGADAKSLPPLRTPSPHEPRTVPPPQESVAPAAVQSAGSERSKPEITPTEPLQPKSAQYTPSDYEGQSLSRQFTVDTVTSSPVKESDVLSEEIMRTLTPGGLTSPTDSDDKRKSQAMPTGRESSYTLSGYDDYWADTADKRKSMAPGGLEDVPEVPPVPIVAPTTAKAPEPAPVSPEPIVSPTSDSQASLRRRFSWEALEESQAAAPATTVDASQASQSSTPVLEATKAVEGGAVAPSGPTSPASPTIKVVPDTSSISHQVSQASSKPATLPTPEPPSPVSELSDRDATPLAHPVVSPTDGNAPPMASPLSSNPVSASQGEAQTPTIVSPTPLSGDKPIMTFREIMEISNPKDRIAKYEETRHSFASQDSGLESWLTTMRSEYPEHANANGSFSGAPISAPSTAGGATGAGQQAPADQPYYQQYLQANANAPGASNTGSARSRIAGYSSQAHAAAGSAFGDGGKQIGTKGKEFMHSAGKMGKGLFSKGKSKLQQAREAREARGDKGETSPPPIDRRPQRPERPERPDRRMSWALNLGGQKTRENGPTPPEASAGYNGDHEHERPDLRVSTTASELSKEPPRLAEPTRISPLLPNPSPTDGSRGVFWQDPNNTRSDVEPSFTDTSTGIPGGPGAQASQRIEPPPNEDSDWVVVPRQSADQHNQDTFTVTAATDQNAHHPQQQRQKPAAALGPSVVPEDSGIGMASQSSATRPDAQRHSSFKGLPPIRRNSSFGLSAFDATGDPGRVSPVEDDDEIQTHNGTASSAVEQQNVNGTLPPHENATNQSTGVDSNATLIGQDSTTRTGRSSMSLSKEPMRFYQGPQQQQQQPLQLDTQQTQPHPGQPGPPDAVNPIQRTPPSGWQLEESHLAAPLHVARRRAGTDSSQQHVTYGYDKETGVSMPMSPTSPGTGSGPIPSPQPPRQRTSDVPPSSARRYPELFRPASQQPQQRGRANSGGQQQMAGYQQYQPRASQEGQPPMDKAQEAGFAVSHEHNEDQGKRRASDIFKGIGGRFKKSNSEERRNSVNGPGFERTDTMTSVNSQGQTSLKKKRTSFLPGALRPRASMDIAPPPQINDPNRPMTQESNTGPQRSGTPQSEKKRSLLGGKLSAAQHKFLPGSQRGSSTSNLPNDTNSTGGAESVNSMGPPKKRFSGLTDKAATFAGRFRHSGEDQYQPGNMPQDPASMSQSSLPPPPPPKTRERSASAASAGSHGMVPPPAPGAESDERRGRRGSFQGMMSNIMGRSSSKTREAESQQPHPQGQFVHQHPGAPTHQQYGGQGPYPPMQGQRYPPGQYPQQPSPQNEQGRGAPIDAGQRASRHLSGQFMQPPRPSPLAQESTAASPHSPVSREENRVVSPERPSNASERATSPSVAPSEGRVSPMPFSVTRKPTKSGPYQASRPQDSIASPVESPATAQPSHSVTSEPSAEGEPSEEIQPSPAHRDEPPLSPVKRQPTPHASALFSSMAASDEPQPPVPRVPQEQSQTQTPQPPEQDPPAGHVRTESVASSRATQSVTGYVPSREHTPVQVAATQGPPSAGPPSGSQQGSPAQARQPEGRFSPQPNQNPQFQYSQQLPHQFMQHRPQGAAQSPQQSPGQQQVPRPGPPQGPQPGPQGPPQPPQGFQQGFNQQQAPGPQGAPQGPPGSQPGFLQNGAPQAQPTQGQSQGQESKLKGWKNRMSMQMAQIKAQSQGQEKPQQEVQQGQQPTKDSWKDRLADMAPSNQVKAEHPQQQAQGHGQPQHDSWKDRLANMAPSAQVKTQHPQMQVQQPVQAQEPPRTGESAPGAQPLQSQAGRPVQASQPQPPQIPQPVQGSQPQVHAPAPAPAPQPAQAKPEKSSWRSRVSGQLPSITPQSSSEKQDKPEKADKPSTGDKLLGALKRASKPVNQPPQPPPKNGQPPQQSQWRPSPVQPAPFGAPPPQQDQGRVHPFAPHNAYGQYAQQAQMRPQQQMPQGQFAQYPPQQQPQWQSQQHPSQPTIPHQQWIYGQQMAMQHQQQAMRPPEPQYDQVPIPKGYGQVHGEYNAAQPGPQGQPLYQGQMHPQQYQQFYQGQYPPRQMQQMQQQAYYQGQVPQQGQPGPVSAVPQGTQQGQQVVAGRESPASPPEQGGFNLPIQGNITPGETNAPQLPLQGAQQQVPQPQQVQQPDAHQQFALERPPAVRADTFTSDTGRSIESGVMGGMGQRVLPPGQPQHGHQLQPQPSTTSMNGQDISGSASQASANAGTAKADISRSTSVNPGVVVDDAKGNNLAIDVDKSKQDVDDNNIYDATPRLKQETTGGSQGVSDQSSANDTKQPTPEPKAAPPVTSRETDASPPMELEDTADARMRSLRIDSQEEKIFYDPEGDVPKMSATSYPGQEWNPYGEPEFADWRDD